MRLPEFILRNIEAILVQWESFASDQLPAAANMGSLALRDHAEPILRAIAKDLATYQSREAQTAKSLGRKLSFVGAPETAAETHAVLRARSGFNINQLAAEYRALRASVLRLWTDAYPPSRVDQFDEATRFNEAIDEALAESISFFSVQVDQARDLLLGMLGHDLRSPLQSIQMTAAYLAALNAGAQVSDAAARLSNSLGSTLDSGRSSVVDPTSRASTALRDRAHHADERRLPAMIVPAWCLTIQSTLVPLRARPS